MIRDSKGRFIRQPPPVPTFRGSWPLFAWLIVTCIALHYAKWPILVVAAIVVFVRCAEWFGQRFPRTTIFIIYFIRGLMSHRRRR